MCQLEKSMEITSFFVMDENFLLHRRRALRLLQLMERHDKAWALNVFSSANVLRSYSMEQLVSMGISWVWMGLEGKDSRYGKLHGTDAFALVRELQSHGIRVLGSTIATCSPRASSKSTWCSTGTGAGPESKVLSKA
jgi:hypothetical protein